MKDQSISAELKQFFDNLVNSSIDLFPRLIIGLLVILLGVLLALVFKNLITRLILYLDRQVNLRLRNRFLSVNLQSTARLAGRIAFWIIILFTIVVVTQMFGLTLLTTWFNALLGYLPNILTAIIIIFIGFVAGRLVGDLLNSSILKRGLGKGEYLGKVVQYIILFVASVIAVDQVGIDIQFLTNLVTIVIASLLFGAALAFGLGASTSVSNILGSYYLQKSYQEGNIVKIGEIEGSIVKITPTAVHIKTKNGMVTIPAKSFSEEKSVLIEKN